MRADAKANHDRLLAVAGTVITEHGSEASMRDIARRAGVGLATLQRHFPTRESLLEALLRTNFDELTARAAQVEAANAPDEALLLWLRDFIKACTNYRGVVTAMVHAIEDPESALHSSCVAMRGSGARLLARAQEAGEARTDLDGADLFALVSSLVWLSDQPGQETRAEHLFEVVMSAVVTTPSRT
ncbi:TetR/AcrR family transcriptional regulator [Lentzea sp. HUAS12]|uniref:TetR/AcrR family transcriptional regulator n=1 Tax=Lentzea sp. HUAS12 TaxID=2951806 RepID=UPI00209C75EB|nr:TetR/AcrR family transcriptional regulator [Lentzea sp. HUAS12]USX52726.1 TetR/AcrR family transcriptional regulator [Lentzea sp. HUAS12]